MSDLSFSTGTIQLHIQGDKERVFEFCPTDSRIADSFLCLVDKVNQKLKQFGEKEKEFAGLSDLEKAKSTAKLKLEIDAFFRNELDRIFGDGTAQLIFKNQDTSALTENGQCVFVNFIYALLPYFESEINKRNAKLAQIIKENKA